MREADDAFIDSLAAKYEITADKQVVIEELFRHVASLPMTEANAFLAEASERLDIQPLHLNITDFPSSSPRSIRIAISEDEVQFLADSRGAAYLKELFAFLEDSTAEFEFVHLGESSDVLRTGSLKLTASRVPGFPAGEDEESPEQMPLLAPVDINPADLFALQFIDPTPGTIPISSGRIYRITGIKTGDTIESWQKTPQSPDPNRNIPFEITGDDGLPLVLLICLDDPGVLFFTRGEIERLLIR